MFTLYLHRSNQPVLQAVVCIILSCGMMHIKEPLLLISFICLIFTYTLYLIFGKGSVILITLICLLFTYIVPASAPQLV